MEGFTRLCFHGDFTRGRPLTDFEQIIAKLIGAKFAVGVNSGTDAIKLSLKALGIATGDEGITTANIFVATAGAILCSWMVMTPFV